MIESVSSTGGHSVTIRSHHNAGGLPTRMNMKPGEPPRKLFNDEVHGISRVVYDVTLTSKPRVTIECE